MTSQLDQSVIEATGGIVERQESGRRVIAVIRRERYGTEWALPKGKRNAHETWQAAALREVREEIGVEARIVGVAGASAYLANDRPKIVLYWRMTFDGRLSSFVPNDEVMEVLWLAPGDAVRRLTHREEANVVRAAFGLD